MFTQKQLAAIAVEEQASLKHPKKYMVVLDRTKNDHGTKDEAVIILKSNSYEYAVETANFWDARMNTHLITMDAHTVELGTKVLQDREHRDQSVKQFARTGLEQLDTQTQEWFDKLSLEEKLEIYFDTAMTRIEDRVE